MKSAVTLYGLSKINKIVKRTLWLITAVTEEVRIPKRIWTEYLSKKFMDPYEAYSIRRKIVKMISIETNAEIIERLGYCNHSGNEGNKIE